MKKSHRVVYEALVGPIPTGLHIDHLCRTPSCVNPAHLEPVTPGENSRRGNTGKKTGAKQRAKTHCVRGHELSGDNLRMYRGKRTCRACIKWHAHERYLVLKQNRMASKQGQYL